MLIFSQICDGNPDCQNGEDEINCTSCKDIPGQFPCDLSRGYPCIHINAVCNGVQDCIKTGRDEVDCDCFDDPSMFPCDEEVRHIFFFRLSLFFKCRKK